MMRRPQWQYAVLAWSSFALATIPAHAFTIAGTVMDAEGAALSDAHVWLTREHATRAQQTDADGHFSFDDVDTGGVHLVAYVDGFALGGIEGPCIRDEDVQIVLAPPQRTRVRVINRRYEPVEGARVSRLRVNDRFDVFVDDLANLDFPVNHSDTEGFLDLPPLPRDSFVSIIISRRGYADGRLPALPAGIADFDFPLPDGVGVVGRITNAAGAGVPGAHVSIYQPREGGTTLEAGEAATGPEGFFSLRVPPGAYYAAAWHADYAMPAPAPLEARELAGDTEVNLVMRDPHRVEGRTLDTTGAPVALARLAYHFDDVVVDEAVSDTRGRFELVVPAGQGTIHITPPYRMTTSLFPRVYLSIHSDEPVIHAPAIEFRPLPELMGQVIAADGVPAGRTLIRSLTLQPPRFFTSDDQGNFTITLDEMPEDTLTFRIDHGLRFQRMEFDVDPINLELPPIRLKEYQPDLTDVNAHAVNDLSSLVGRPAPEFACTAWFNLPDDRESLAVEDLRGKVVVLTLWAGFDMLGPSRHRAEELNAVQYVFENVDDVAFVGIHDSTVPPEQVAGIVRELGFQFPVGCDEAPYESFARYLTRQIPQTVLIDKRGRVRFFATKDRLVELIKVLRRE
jgi:hypothetical protein